MSNLTIRQAVQGMLKLQDSGDHATMVGIGPMSQIGRASCRERV